MAWDIELHRYENGAFFAIGVTPRGVAWIADNVGPVEEDNSSRLDPSDGYEYVAKQIVAAGLTVIDTTPTEGERASHAASQAARALTYL